MDWQYEIGKRKEKLWMWFVWKLPKPLVYWCAVRLMSAATTGEHSGQVVPELTALEALERWK